MKKLLLLTGLLLLLFTASAQSRFSKHEIGINGFRNPSIGLEYRYRILSLHAGYYPTNFTSNVTTSFVKVGVTAWFLPIGKRQNPSSFYTSVSYLRGLTRDYKDENAGSVDVGFRWMIWKGLNLRIGALALFSPDQDLKINPTPGIGYAFFLN